MSTVTLPKYKVTAVNMGYMRVDHSVMVYDRGFGTPLDIPTWVAAIEGEGARILVDTGIADPAWVEREMVPCWQGPDETFDAALSGIAWRAQDIDIVINTHLHHDHCANNSRVPGARFYVTADEWEYAASPVATQRVLYNKAWLAGELSQFSYNLVPHDYYDVLPGLRLIKTAGHTPGHQSVLVNTAEGVLCVTGDIVNSLESFAGPTPCGINTSVTEALASIEKIRSSAHRVLMSHDTTLTKYQNSGFPTIESDQS
jgi:glyoxylase-like metal-dependent hydrolase (beta-lactamase superfamily II)